VPLFNHYTAQLREYVENLPINREQPNLSHRQAIENGRTKLFDFDYPLFDESYRNVFETKFIRKFYTREIGFETFGLFKFQLETWLIINMPFFNKLFESELLQYDPLTNFKVDETHSLTNNKNQNESRSSNENRNIDSDTDTTSSRTGSATNEVIGNTSSSAEHEENTNVSGSVDSSLTKDVTNNETDTAFNRKLESETPDSRLTITSNNGEGVIEYASKIDETSDTITKTISNNETNTSSDNSRTDSASHSNENSIVDTTTNSTASTTDNVTEQYHKRLISQTN
jgi:hypothetical protein